MPPLTTPATAIVFMIVFFAAMMGLPLLILRLPHHHAHLTPAVGAHHKGHKMILAE